MSSSHEPVACGLAIANIAAQAANNNGVRAVDATMTVGREVACDTSKLACAIAAEGREGAAEACSIKDKVMRVERDLGRDIARSACDLDATVERTSGHVFQAVKGAETAVLVGQKDACIEALRGQVHMERGFQEDRRRTEKAERRIREDVERSRFAVELQAEKTRALLELQAERNEAKLSRQMQECCCELKSTVRASADATQDMIQRNREKDLAALLTASQSELNLLRLDVSLLNGIPIVGAAAARRAPGPSN
jgi:hypothetical protein